MGSIPEETDRSPPISVRQPTPSIGPETSIVRADRSPAQERFLRADGLCTASPPDFSLRTRYCGSSSEALTLRPAASVSEEILRSTWPTAPEPWELHSTLSPCLNSVMAGRLPSGRERQVPSARPIRVLRRGG